MHVQFVSEDPSEVKHDFGILGINAEIIPVRSRPGGGVAAVVVAQYDHGKPAMKLREWIESHHVKHTTDGKIVTLPVDGWDDLLEHAVLH